ncbi:MAG TPA: TPM domain-containing protein, partial [Pyrinomonadaceae bacterium]|nr:TPM domain-containing protein [Pyrinomonadaceae bacterium]
MTERSSISASTAPRPSVAGLYSVLACLACACVILFSASRASYAQTGESPVLLPSPFTPVVDNANVIDSETRTRIESIYRNLKERADIEFAVVTIDTTGGRDISEYTLDVYRGWGIGSKTNDGFLLLLAIQDRKYFTEVGYHLEGDLNDGLVGEIQRSYLVPQLRKGNYSKGIYDTVQAYVATLAQKRGFTVEGIDQSYAYRQAPTSSSGRDNSGRVSSPCCTLLIILGVIILLLSSTRRGGGGRGGGGGWWKLFLLGSLLNSGSRGGWGGSSSGWGGGGFGGGGGGF